MTQELEQITPAAELAAEEEKTLLMIEKLDRSAVGSYQVIRAWQMLYHTYSESRYQLSMAEEALKMARLDFATHPTNEKAKAQLHKDQQLFFEAEKYFLASQTALESHYIKRFSTADGSPVEDAIAQLSLEQWTLLVDSDLEAINVPKKKNS